METSDIRKLTCGALEGALKRYRQDLDAIPEDRFAVSAGGSSRSAADFTVEVTTLNNRFAVVLRGEEPGPFEWKGWMKAEGDQRDKAKSIETYQQSADALLAAMGALSDEGLVSDVKGFGGPVPAYEYIQFTAIHINYHDGQLNLLQAVHGDEQVHWS